MHVGLNMANLANGGCLLTTIEETQSLAMMQHTQVQEEMEWNV
jgi:hypothetical protein